MERSFAVDRYAKKLDQLVEQNRQVAAPSRRVFGITLAVIITHLVLFLDWSAYRSFVADVYVENSGHLMSAALMPCLAMGLGGVSTALFTLPGYRRRRAALDQALLEIGAIELLRWIDEHAAEAKSNGTKPRAAYRKLYLRACREVGSHRRDQ